MPQDVRESDGKKDGKDAPFADRTLEGQPAAMLANNHGMCEGKPLSLHRLHIWYPLPS